MGIATVAVYSDADADSPHVEMADEAVRIGPPPSSESYLVIEKILDAAEQVGADAIHPGYGFLAENAEFAQACADAGRIFIGPTADAIRSMGSKQRAKAIAVEAGVEVIPGYAGEDQSDEVLVEEAKKIGFPVLLKASAGGGGKGMRVVDDPAELDCAIAAARRESASSFGDDTLLIERYVQSPRHVEIQILGDVHGNVVHLFERECSIQRRHQKIVEETPSTALDQTLRSRMGAAAVKVAKAIGYRNAGTVEFILAPNGEFYFLEVNTRLQVEHPVTECVTGLDLVREQIHLAEGRPLPFAQDDIEAHGAAIECRLYAEDPANGFLPSTGTLVDWHVPEGLDVRVDSGVRLGSVVGIHYDPMLAKVITSGDDREEAIRKMVYALSQMSVQGVTTNLRFLIDVLDHRAFHGGETDTHFIDNHLSDWPAGPDDENAVCRALVAATFWGHQERVSANPILPALVTGYRNNPYVEQWADWDVGAEPRTLHYRNLGGGRFSVRVDEWTKEALLLACKGSELALELDGRLSRFRVGRDGARFYVHEPGTSTVVVERPRFPEKGSDFGAGGYLSPMPGKIISVKVQEGDAVKDGDVLIILEAMKMEHTILASAEGVVEKVLVEEGEQVDADAPLIIVVGEDS